MLQGQLFSSCSLNGSVYGESIIGEKRSNAEFLCVFNVSRAEISNVITSGGKLIRIVDSYSGTIFLK